MAYQSRVSEAVIRRLPVYYRHLQELERLGVERISSRELGEEINFTASQIRQDINCFGGFGQQGYGYHVPSLRRHIGKILGLENAYSMVILGAGNIGRAIAGYTGFQQEGFRITAIFDADEKLIGTKVSGIEVRDSKELDAFLASNHVDIGVIAVPAESAQEAANQLTEGGVKAIWNFAPTDLRLPEDAVGTHVHLTDSLHILTYMMNEEALFEEMDRQHGKTGTRR